MLHIDIEVDVKEEIPPKEAERIYGEKCADTLPALFL